MTLLEKVKQYLRVNGGDSDVLIASLISAAKQYLLNSGVEEPETLENGELEEPGEGEIEDGEGEEEPPTDADPLALYELAVVLYVNILYHGGSEDILTKAMDSVILQIKNWGEST